MLSRTPAGYLARSSSSSAIDPLRSNSRTLPAVALPMPCTAVSSASVIVETSRPKPRTASPARR